MCSVLSANHRLPASFWVDRRLLTEWIEDVYRRAKPSREAILWSHLGYTGTKACHILAKVSLSSHEASSLSVAGCKVLGTHVEEIMKSTSWKASGLSLLSYFHLCLSSFFHADLFLCIHTHSFTICGLFPDSEAHSVSLSLCLSSEKPTRYHHPHNS